MPVLIIEGCDGTGKSTLAERCVEAAQTLDMYNVRLEHYGVPSYDPESPLSIGQQAMNQLLERFADFRFATDFMVIDRFHWGEPVYAPVFRPDRCVDPLFGTLHFSEFWYVEEWLRSVGAIVAYCYAPPGVIVDRVMRERAGVEDLIADSGDAQAKTLQILDRYERVYTYLTAENRGHRRAENIRPIELLKPSDTEIWANRLVKDASERSMDIQQEFIRSHTPKLMEASA